MRRLLACLVVAWFANPADACINDVELPSHEREFRSQYRQQSTSPSTPRDTAGPASNRLLLGGGGVLLIGAMGLVVVRRARG